MHYYIDSLATFLVSVLKYLTKKKNLKGGVYFGSGFEGQSALHGGETKAASTQSSWLRCVCSQEAESNEYSCSANLKVNK